MDYFPIFADLRRRAVLLVGAGQVAQRKAESLMQAGAQVRVAAETLNPQFAAWLAQGRIRHIGTAFDAAFLAEVFLVVAATDDNALNQKIFSACERAGKLCNTVDAREQCSFIVPAVIDRSPLQVAVSSGGTAPVLARKIRTQIETLLPPNIGRAAALAGKWRARVKAAVAALPQRRRFWEKLFDGDFVRYAAAGDGARADAELLRLLAEDAPPRRGSVTLVGAGPGDAGLLTLNALHALQAADVVLYDALVSEEILAMARRDAEKISVGKRAGSHSVQQEETNRLLLRFAHKGRRVVRLKGGDPFVFGRGGEECQVLAAAGIDFAVIPGITAALGAAAAAGIPLTHRDYAHGVQLVTAHGQKADTPDWAGLARGGQTLVLYMGTLNAGEIAAQLTAHGRSPETPAAVVSHATRAGQSVRAGCLKDLAVLAENAPTPALLIIGEVVALRHEWADSARTAREKGEIQAA